MVDTKDQSLLHLLTKRESISENPTIPPPFFPLRRPPFTIVEFRPTKPPLCMCLGESCPWYCRLPRPRDPIPDWIRHLVNMRGHLLIVVVVVVVCQLTNSMADTDTKDQSLLHLLTKRESLFPTIPPPFFPRRWPPSPTSWFLPTKRPVCMCVLESCPLECLPRPPAPILDPTCFV
ncbi:hypothetical protein C0Q70_06706 [Pomacea canaliculata]|uniref:Uncharacterized protein n=1 Tax=Pomacea canaliculata TaxID=400727 RepID=A0A2T7PD07_POMCA|nr:hypothetical protein C0Q70_06706 [Pomacea canaliculata]